MDQNLMTPKDKILFWLIGVLLFICFIYFVSDILLPFVVALITAYFLDPAADKLEDMKLSRALSTLIITAAFFFVVVLVAILLVPILYDQFVSMVHKIPQYVAMINSKVIPSFSKILHNLGPEAIENAKSAVSNVSGYIFQFFAKILSNIWNSGIAIVNLLSLIFITPIVTFYMLRDWDKITSQIDKLLPPSNKKNLRNIITQIDRTLSGYIRGQTNVCLLLGIFYAIGLSIVGLEFSLFIGMATGILSFIPYVGVLFGFTVGLATAFFQFGDFTHMAIVAVVFIIGQMLEGSFITPKLVGDKVGLHPVWIIFGMLSGATMFGFVGILIAVPVTAIIGVLVRFAIGEYVKSPLYKKKTNSNKKKNAARSV